MSLPLNILDKENSINMSLESQKDSENINISQKKNTLQQNQPLRKRIPLGGKDVNNGANGAFPSLKRSQSSLNTDIHNTSALQRKKATLLNKPPSLQKANSSLGFIHRAPLDISKKESSSPKLDVNDALASKLLNSDNAARSKELEGQYTDTLAKQHLSLQPQDEASIPDIRNTFSRNTRSIHSSFIPTLEVNSSDPVKGGKPNLSSALVDESLLEKLSEDPSNIETIPDRATRAYHIPLGIEPLDKDDLEFFSKSTRKVLPTENKHEYEEIHRKEVNLKFRDIDLDDPSNFNFDENERVEPEEVEVEELKNIGLTAEELNNLLDY
ncbi:hypothetical protein CLIB1423_02S04478 [[Candida] railenensis]|uniref:Securin n=1 Tax=[Candida] railenensis TaxID=45579 RepID=A0A9P0QLA2_9ASCO|nr:hypothetical protein CLIB1423_02S04478 [[Candida] railenensis]